ncbi:prephenate dehydrogenase [Candidatus Gastranaerophilus sp. (ex Termes propinquus)]|nr:prephenate dehydrogenase [Candidatus Gastranaerophilus sp. (ex Termes propinquus)]
MANLKIGISGLGLIGGSILKRLHEKGFYTIAVSKSSCEKAKSWADVCSVELGALKEADVVFVCNEMHKTPEILDEFEGFLPSEVLVTDVCSLKSFVLQKTRPYSFVGSHPMAGTEFTGFEASFPSLFEGAKWALTEQNETLEFLISEMGAKPVFIEANEHDRAVAKISHLPMLLAHALFMSTADDKCAKLLAASGFRDMTRLAMGSPYLSGDMLELNEKNIELALDETLKALEYLKKLPKEERIEAFAKNAHNRAEMYDKQGKNTL